MAKYVWRDSQLHHTHTPSNHNLNMCKGDHVNVENTCPADSDSSTTATTSNQSCARWFVDVIDERAHFNDCIRFVRFGELIMPCRSDWPRCWQNYMYSWSRRPFTFAFTTLIIYQIVFELILLCADRCNYTLPGCTVHLAGHLHRNTSISHSLNGERNVTSRWTSTDESCIHFAHWNLFCPLSFTDGREHMPPIEFSLHLHTLTMRSLCFVGPLRNHRGFDEVGQWFFAHSGQNT